MNLFLKVFADAISESVMVNWECKGQTFKSKIQATCCCVDAPAKVAMLNMKVTNAMAADTVVGCKYAY